MFSEIIWLLAQTHTSKIFNGAGDTIDLYNAAPIGQITQ